MSCYWTNRKIFLGGEYPVTKLLDLFLTRLHDLENLLRWDSKSQAVADLQKAIALLQGLIEDVGESIERQPPEEPVKKTKKATKPKKKTCLITAEVRWTS